MFTVMNDLQIDNIHHDFISRLEMVQAEVIAIGIDNFDTTLSYESLLELSPHRQIKTAWAIHKMATLIHQIAITSPQNHSHFFLDLFCFNKIATMQSEIAQSLSLMTDNNAVFPFMRISDPVDFKLAVNFFGLLQILNPNYTRGIDDILHLLYQQPANWLEISKHVPMQLQQCLLQYFMCLSETDRAQLWDSIPKWNWLYASFTQRINLEATDSTIEQLKSLLATVTPPSTHEIQSYLNRINEKISALNKLKNLLKKSQDESITLHFLQAELNNHSHNILELLKSNCSSPDSFGLLSIEQKAIFIIDSIVESPIDSPSSLFRWFVTSSPSPSSPGKTVVSEILQRDESIFVIDKPENLYSKSKDDNCRQSLTMIDEQQARLATEQSLFQLWKPVEDSIDEFKSRKNMLMAKLLMLLARLENRFKKLLTDTYTPDEVILYQELLTKHNIHQDFEKLKVFSHTITMPHDLSAYRDILNILNGSLRVRTDISRLNSSVDEMDSLINRFDNLTRKVQDLEVSYQLIQQNRLLPNVTYKAHVIPYAIWIAFLAASMIAALSLIVYLTNPGLFFIVLPMLGQFAIPIGMAMGLGAGVMSLACGLYLAKQGLFMPHGTIAIDDLNPSLSYPSLV